MVEVATGLYHVLEDFIMSYEAICVGASFTISRAAALPDQILEIESVAEGDAKRDA